MSWKRVSKKVGKDPPAVQRKLKAQQQNFLESYALVAVPGKELFQPEVSGSWKTLCYRFQSLL